MPTDVASLRKQVDQALSEKRPADAVCYLAEIVAATPDDRFTRTALAIALGDAGHPAGALKVLRALADRLAHEGSLLPAMVVIRVGLEHAPNDASLLSTLKRLHVRGVRAKANMATPPALKQQKSAGESVSAETLLKLTGQERLERVTQIGTEFPAAGEAATPQPMPLFSDLGEDSYVEVVHRLRYFRAPKGKVLLKEGDAGSSLLILASGNVQLDKGGHKGARLESGAVLGEMALTTGAPNATTATADSEIEVFELQRVDVESLSKTKPDLAEEIIAACRKRVVGNMLQALPLFERFDDATRYTLVDRFKRAGFQAGETIMEQGKAGKGLYVLVTGDVQVTANKDGNEVVLGKLGPGDVIGELSLLRDDPSKARVVAQNQVGALFLPQSEFRTVLDEHKDVKDHLDSLSADHLPANVSVAEVLEADDLVVS